mgnify:CR=1 FL=1
MHFEFLVAIFTLLIIILLSRLAHFVGLLDKPNNSTKIHGFPTPVIGGIAIVCVMFVVLLSSQRPPKLDILLLCTVGVGILGALDDLLGLRVSVRIVAQIGVGLAMALGAGVQIEDLGPIVGHEIAVPNELQVLLTVCFVAVVMNAVNMSDGIDGNAAGLVLICLGLIALGQYLFVGEVRKPDWLGSLIVSVMVFWIVNVSLTPLKKVFLGDAGTLALGFVVSWLCVDFSQGPGRSIHPAMVGWALLVPLCDFFSVFIFRLLTGRLPTTGGREHAHHFLAKVFGQNDKKALIFLLGLASSLGCFGVILTAYSPAVGYSIFIATALTWVWCQVRYGLLQRERTSGTS